MRTFPNFYANGNLHIVVPPRRFYPGPWFFVKRKYKDDERRVRWRTKQNLDVSMVRRDQLVLESVGGSLV